MFHNPAGMKIGGELQTDQAVMASLKNLYHIHVSLKSGAAHQFLQCISMQFGRKHLIAIASGRNRS